MAALAVLATLTAAEPPSSSPKLPKVQENEFAGKILAIEPKDFQQGALVKDVYVKQLGGRSFLVGTIATGKMKVPYPEVTCWFPVDNVTRVSVYNNLEDAVKVYEAWQDQVKKVWDTPKPWPDYGREVETRSGTPSK
jgi:hypothetical protein